MPRWLKGLLGVTVGAGVCLGGLVMALSHSVPPAIPGPEAQARAARIEAAVGLDQWARTGAVSFVFAGRNRHLWDRERELYRVAFGSTVVMMDLKTRQGRAWSGDVELQAAARDAALETAWSLWCNDTYWLNPLAKLRDPGVELAAVDLSDGTEGLLVHYSQGGVTPGDRYLWLLGDDDLPRAWRMWVSIIPIPGVQTSWEGWTELPTGAKISTHHALGPIALDITELRAATTLAELEPGPDPFAAAGLIETPE